MEGLGEGGLGADQRRLVGGAPRGVSTSALCIHMDPVPLTSHSNALSDGLTGDEFKTAVRNSQEQR